MNFSFKDVSSFEDLIFIEMEISMKIFQAIIMGIIQGITEFVPVSSSGHLALLKSIFGMETDTGVFFDVLLHVATIVAICVAFYKDIIRLFLEFCFMIKDICLNIGVFAKSVSGSSAKENYIPIISNSYRKFVLMLIISTIPTGIIGIFLKDVVDYATGNLLITGVCFISTGLIVMLSDYIQDKGKRLKDANYGDAFCVGVAQGIATLPGLSRSGVTVGASLLCGFDRKFASKYSFIMSIPAILGALVLEIGDIGSETITGADIGSCFVGMIFAAAIGIVALKLIINLINRKALKYFSFYCIGLGFLSFIIYIIRLK